MNIGILSYKPHIAERAIRNARLMAQKPFDAKSRCISSTQAVFTPIEFFEFMDKNDIFVVLIGYEVNFDTSNEDYDESAFKKMIAQKYTIVWGGNCEPQVIPFG